MLVSPHVATGEAGGWIASALSRHPLFGSTPSPPVCSWTVGWKRLVTLEGVVSGLERQPLVLHKDLHAAIAAAFQIAESQRQLI